MDWPPFGENKSKVIISDWMKTPVSRHEPDAKQSYHCK